MESCRGEGRGCELLRFDLGEEAGEFLRGVLGLFCVLGPLGCSLAGLGFRPNLGLVSFPLVSALFLPGMSGGSGPKRVLLGFSFAGLGFRPNLGLVSLLELLFGSVGKSVAGGARGTRGGSELNGAALGSVHAGIAARVTPSVPLASFPPSAELPPLLGPAPLVPLALPVSVALPLGPAVSFKFPPSPLSVVSPDSSTFSSPPSVCSSSAPRTLRTMTGEGTGESGTGCAVFLPFPHNFQFRVDRLGFLGLESAPTYAGVAPVSGSSSPAVCVCVSPCMGLFVAAACALRGVSLRLRVAMKMIRKMTIRQNTKAPIAIPIHIPIGEELCCAWGEKKKRVRITK